MPGDANPADPGPAGDQPPPLSWLEFGRAPWIGDAADTDVVLSSRVRLARNVAGFRFVSRLDDADRRSVLSLLRTSLNADGPRTAPSTNGEPRRVWLDIDRLDRADRALLVERHLISTAHAKGVLPSGGHRPPSARGAARALLVSVPDERVSVMLNEEDHLRIQAIVPGLALGEAALLANRIDDEVERSVDYAFSARFGYLTACPTNIGTGARLSVMLHLPALRLLGEIDKVRRAANDMALAVRGFWGEGSDSPGDFYQLSNQTTLGHSEDSILQLLEGTIVPRVLEYERRARERLLSSRRSHLEDTVFRALGILTHARRISTTEAIQRLSEVRLGAASGLLRSPSLNEVSRLLMLVQPEHVRRSVPGASSDAMRAARATLIREATERWA